eukprot:2324237-Rhodomonas_salina.1
MLEPHALHVGSRSVEEKWLMFLCFLESFAKDDLKLTCILISRSLVLATYTAVHKLLPTRQTLNPDDLVLLAMLQLPQIKSFVCCGHIN